MRETDSRMATTGMVENAASRGRNGLTNSSSTFSPVGSSMAMKRLVHGVIRWSMKEKNGPSVQRGKTRSRPLTRKPARIPKDAASWNMSKRIMRAVRPTGSSRIP